jgi:uncharacterized membrane protein YeiH
MAYSAVLLLDYLSCALLGCAAAFRGGRHSLPFTGALILGMTCALISPAARSILISISTQIMPLPAAFDERGYVAASFVGACAGWLLQRRASEEAPVFPVLEGAALALAAALGTHVALALGLASPVGGVVIGCVAGTVGGVLRDLCLTERPALLEVDFYGSAVAVGAMAVTGLHVLQADFWTQMAVGGLCAFGLRLFGSWRTRRLGIFSEF